MADAIYSYIQSMDYGFAPNPFHGFCTLACCKSQVRRGAKIGDFIVGTTGCRENSPHPPKIIYIMRVTRIVTWQEYWKDAEFRCKKVVAPGSIKLRHGDNIYYLKGGEYHQVNSRHSNPDGTMNWVHRDSDTGVDKILLADDGHFVYLGRNMLEIPDRFRNFKHSSDLLGSFEDDLVALNRRGRGSRSHKKITDPEFIAALEEWFESLPKGVQGLPSGWMSKGRRKGKLSA